MARAGIVSFIIFLLATLAIGLIGSAVTLPEIGGWYASLHKAPWNPPPWVFGPVWTTLYILIATAGWRLWRQDKSDIFKQPAGQFYIVQLILNAMWSPVFFGLHAIWAGLIIIVAMLVTITLTIQYASRKDIWAVYLLVPYLLWVGYAFTLNAYIAFYN